MNARVLGVIAVVGVLLVGLAIFYMADPPESPREKRTLPGRASTSKTLPSGDRQRSELPPALRPRTPIVPDDEPEEAEEEPEITLDQARRDFQAFIADLDREVARLEKTGGKLTEAEYTQYRTRGANAMDAVLRRLDHRNPEMMVEVKEMQDAARTRLDRIKP